MVSEQIYGGLGLKASPSISFNYGGQRTVMTAPKVTL
jgi:hypothetical protein